MKSGKTEILKKARNLHQRKNEKIKKLNIGDFEILKSRETESLKGGETCSADS